ncbi:MAG TPA: hypothetical protein VKP67_06620 [Xanthobacteraceae bacterium]|nr:hypothetical protein [Xanthobacteraceae bacterium]
MNSRLSIARAAFSRGRWDTEPSDDPPLHPTELDFVSSKRSSRRKRALFALIRFVITFAIGVAAVLAWQSYGDAARAMIARSSPRLAWLAPPAPPPAQAAPTAFASASPDQIKAISQGLAVVRQSVDKLAAEVTKLQVTKPDTADRTSAPPPAAASVPVRKPVTPALPVR